MKRLLGQVGDGKLVFEERLRKGDELQDFFEAFASMTERLRARRKKELDELGRAIDAAKAAGVGDDALAKVVGFRDDLKRAVD
jgi:hypothetical protein